MDTLLKFDIHIPTYAGLLSANVTLFLQIATKLLPNIFCDIYLGFDEHFKYYF